MYLYTGAADVAAQTGDTSYVKAMKNVWNDVVDRNMYITGGIGSSGSNEGFSKDYDLPNEQAYCETCASVGMVFWNQRMNARSPATTNTWMCSNVVFITGHSMVFHSPAIIFMETRLHPTAITTGANGLAPRAARQTLQGLSPRWAIMFMQTTTTVFG